LELIQYTVNQYSEYLPFRQETHMHHAKSQQANIKAIHPKRGRRFFCLAALSVAAGLSLPAAAADFPSRPVRIVVPFSPGAAADTVARLIANGLSKRWDQQVIVDNRTGGNTLIGMEAVARAQPDGHTLLFTVN